MGKRRYEDTMKKKKDDCLQTKERYIRIKQPCQELDIRLLGFRIVKKWEFCCLSHSSLWFSFWQLSIIPYKPIHECVNRDKDGRSTSRLTRQKTIPVFRSKSSYNYWKNALVEAMFLRSRMQLPKNRRMTEKEHTEQISLISDHLLLLFFKILIPSID